MNHSINWNYPTTELIPDLMVQCGTEEIGYRDESKLSVTKYCTTFENYTGDEEIPSYGGKAIVVDDGNPTYAEFKALSLFRMHGWEGLWYDSYRRKKRLSLNEDAECAESVNDLLNSIASITGSPTGVFDLVLWRGETIYFVELKRKARDQIRNTQIDWLHAALSLGLDLACFAILQWELKE